MQTVLSTIYVLPVKHPPTHVFLKIANPLPTYGYPLPDLYQMKIEQPTEQDILNGRYRCMSCYVDGRYSYGLDRLRALQGQSQRWTSTMR